MIQGAQISNSFILLMVLNEATQGYVEGVDVNDKSLYSITQKQPAGLDCFSISLFIHDGVSLSVIMYPCPVGHSGRFIKPWQVSKKHKSAFASL
jgi:hypothetical protein